MAQRREEESSTGAIILLMDGSTAGAFDDRVTLLRSCQIVPACLSVHASDQIQPLELGIFSHPRHGRTQRIAIQMASRQNSLAIRIVDAWQRAGLPRVIVSAFQAAGLAGTSVMVIVIASQLRSRRPRKSAIGA
jgi:hypothetical protein